MSNQKHTATPYKFTHDHRNGQFEIETVTEEPYRHLTNNMPMQGQPDNRAACGCDREALATARFLVRAANAHDELVEALKDIIEQFESTHLVVGADLADSIRVFGKQALAKAKGK